MKKVEVLITDYTHQGFGVGKIDGFPIFIPGALVGERVSCEIEKQNKSFGYASLREVLSPSRERVKPRCDIFGICGGCDLMHMNYKAQLNFKMKMAEDSFRKLGHLNIKVNKIIGMDEPYYYRNKVQVAFGMRDQKVICGYYQKKSHHIASFDYCYIQPEYTTKILTLIRNLANEYKIAAYDEENHRGIIRHVLVRNNYLGEVLIAIITRTQHVPNLDKIVKRIIEVFPQVKAIIHNINDQKTNVVLGDKSFVLYGDDYLIDKIDNLKFKISFNSFFQVNLPQTEKLYQIVCDYLNPKQEDIIVDGYCGVGTITLMIARHCQKIYGIEVVPDAIRNARENARLNNIKNAKFIVGKVETEIFNLLQDNLTAIILDPPRKGVDRDVLLKIIDAKIPKTVYVSCNVGSLARDLRILSENYHIEKVTLVDMFPHTADVESVVLLKQK